VAFADEGWSPSGPPAEARRPWGESLTRHLRGRVVGAGAA
jgi:hypothetical protein